MKDWAVHTFGESDKLVLQLGVLVVLMLLSLVVGVLALRDRRLGVAGVSLFGVVGFLAATTRPASEPLDGAPSLAGVQW